MPYLVDGNNLMAQTIGWSLDKAGARKRVILDLARFVAVNKVKMKVVFDGSPDAEFPEGCKFKSVEILYARPGSDADSRIKQLVEQSSNVRDLIVVTSDRSLGSTVSRRGAKVIQSGKFKQMIQSAASHTKEKPAEQEPVNVDDWLTFFGDREK